MFIWISPTPSHASKTPVTLRIPHSSNLQTFNRPNILLFEPATLPSPTFCPISFATKTTYDVHWFSYWQKIWNHSKFYANFMQILCIYQTIYVILEFRYVGHFLSFPPPLFFSYFSFFSYKFIEIKELSLIFVVPFFYWKWKYAGFESSEYANLELERVKACALVFIGLEIFLSLVSRFFASGWRRQRSYLWISVKYTADFRNLIRLIRLPLA
jgi:hypothetical protein